MPETSLKYSDLTGIIIGAAMEVHSQLGAGFQEQVYQRALSVELNLRGVKHELEYQMPILYKGIKVGARRVDIFAQKMLPVELKAAPALDSDHMAQAINYLEAYHLETGLLINFGGTSLQFKRLFNKQYQAPATPGHNP